MEIENAELKKAVEALLFITDHALSAEQLAKMTTNVVKDAKRVRAIIAELQKEYEERGSAVQVLEIADGFQMGTRPQFAQYVRKLFADKMTMKLSTAAHETLSIIAYKQPLTRAEIEQIRGVEVIAVLEALVEKRLVKVVGRKETVGRPLMYGTTEDFLRHFGLVSLDQLPPLDNFSSDPTISAVSQQPETGEAAWQDAGGEQAEQPAAAVSEGENLADEGGQTAVEEGAHASEEQQAGEPAIVEEQTEAVAEAKAEARAEDVPDAPKKSIWDEAESESETKS